MRRIIGFGFALILALAVGGWAQSSTKKDKAPAAKGNVEKSEKPAKPAGKGRVDGKVLSAAADSARADSLRRVRLERWKLRVEGERKAARERDLAGLAPERRAKVEEAERKGEVQRRRRDSLNLAYMAEMRAQVRQKGKAVAAAPSTPATSGGKAAAQGSGKAGKR